MKVTQMGDAIQIVPQCQSERELLMDLLKAFDKFTTKYAPSIVFESVPSDKNALVNLEDNAQ